LLCPSTLGQTVTKPGADRGNLLYSTFLGGSDRDGGGGVAIDPEGNAYVSGWTESTDYPTSLEAFDTTFGGGEGDAVEKKR
jgi:Beta-propeller repeat